MGTAQTDVASAVPGAPIAEIWYVGQPIGRVSDGTSWGAAFSNIQDAAKAASAGDQVWVAAGTYRVSCDRDIVDRTATLTLRDGVTYLGGFAGNEVSSADRDPEHNPTVLSGDSLGNDDGSITSTADNSLHVITAVGTDSSTRLDGFIISGGVGGIVSGPAAGPCGGGILLVGASPRISFCHVMGNRAMTGGGMCAIAGSNPHLDHCVFALNIATEIGGGLAAFSCNPVIEDCRFEGNGEPSGSLSGRGGAIFFQSCAPVITRDLFVGNHVGHFAGAINLVNSSTSISRCVFLANEALGTWAAIAITGANAPTMIADSIFSGNHTQGVVSAIQTDSAHVTIERCTFSGNSADSGGGCISVNGASFRMSDSIVWGNSSAGVTDLMSQIVIGPWLPAAVVERSCIEGLGSVNLGAANIGDDPQFKDALGADGVAGTLDDDLTPRASSPCIDSGDPNEILGLDASGAPRWIDGDFDGHLRLDMGALEFSRIRLHLSEGRSKVLKITVANALPLECQLLVALRPGETLIAPFGEVFLNLHQPWARVDLGLVSGTVDLPVPTFPAGPVSVWVQGLAISPTGALGNLSNAVQVDLSLEE